MSDRPMIDMVEIMQHGECCDLRRHSYEEAPRLLGIVAYHRELVVQPREYSLNSLLEKLIRPSVNLNQYVKGLTLFEKYVKPNAI